MPRRREESDCAQCSNCISCIHSHPHQLHCNQSLSCVDKRYYVTHYLAVCSNIPLSVQMQKQKEDEFTPDEPTAFRTLSENSVTWLQLKCRKRALLRPTYSRALLIFAFPIYARQMLFCEICALSKLRNKVPKPVIYCESICACIF
jgi:hypothetical protein